MQITLNVRCQQRTDTPGRVVACQLTGLDPEKPFLKLPDVFNGQLTRRNEEPVASDYDCRKGIYGSCALFFDNCSHGLQTGAVICQLYMRSVRYGETSAVECYPAPDRKPLNQPVSDGVFAPKTCLCAAAHC